jgi:hypothetical protein
VLYNNFIFAGGGATMAGKSAAPMGEEGGGGGGGCTGKPHILVCKKTYNKVKLTVFSQQFRIMEFKEHEKMRLQSSGLHSDGHHDHQN